MIGDLSALFISIIAAAFFIGAPVFFTIYNIISLVKPWEKLTDKQKLRRFIIVPATVLSGIFDCLAYGSVAMEITEKEYHEPLILTQEEFHREISGEYGTWFYVMCFISVVSLCVMLFTGGKRKPPLVSVLLTGFCSCGVVLALLYIIQTAKGFPEICVIWVYPLNLILIYIRLLLDECDLWCDALEDNIPQTGISGAVYKLLSQRSGLLTAGLAMMLPITGVLLIVLILSGQGADSLVKAFTMTADWTFSTQIPPPPIEYTGHYLCTVAAGGHKKVVKPVRMGLRNGQKIVVNRQLMIANAFEDMLIDKTPRLHKALRSFYDKYGYPVSKHITTPLRADIVYIIMKPLEWIFLTALYLFDKYPENRIAIQYTGRKYRERKGDDLS